MRLFLFFLLSSCYPDPSPGSLTYEAAQRYVGPEGRVLGCVTQISFGCAWCDVQLADKTIRLTCQDNGCILMESYR